MRPSGRTLDTMALKEFLSHQRWFAGKGREFAIDEIYPLTWLSEPDADPAVRIELVRVRYRNDETEVYQLPLEYRSAPVDHLAHVLVAHDESTYVYDALHDKEVTGLLLSGLLTLREEPDLAFHRVGAPSISPGEQSLVLTVEQSNTSLVFGEATLLKVFRKLHHGRNPDIEIHEALTTDGGRNIADLHGWIEGRWPDTSGDVRSGDLGMFSEFFRTATNGWELAITSVRDLYAEGDLHPDEVGGDFAGESYRLGRTLAQVHADMARTLATATWERPEIAAMTDAMRARLTAAVDIAPALEPYAKDLDALLTPDIASSVTVQRIHGDLHLGQTMRTVGGWRLIDFEGEPAKPLAERESLDSPLRDVAGMLRSFDYAAQHLLVEQDNSIGLDGTRGTMQDATEQLEFRAREWAARNRAAFCDGYAAEAGADPRDQDALLRAYEVDKAVYEVVYETRHRPTWLEIPLNAIARLTSPTT